ncbi:Glycosyltransferase, catalytic subunit of cellulose synthase and poly-beta-1,6-N-acetylglucosamine synthase [Klenkia soli]|uniref:Glycosyltransferase, catalytic subunit of cellulose synthase and poly-beta-1,6-N-acetylglucosamine synthase n=1 Tax=Klenkia soli TaxID=1052260 RepID=A0A1H0JKL6_9ACTN|nr:glycosyltransferase [Klenkia soli]SDO44327.1 Glycosyltransferase, catalytic subunit of cellulose synthase and poly-beta-1,6-N-acetylglucosamine synthase [Klenkia soli]
MNEDNIALAALNTTAFMLCVSFLLYIVFIMRPFLARADSVPGSRQGYDLHFVVPCLDEELVVGGTVRHLLGTFPEATVWVVDDASTDLTPDILDDLQDQFPELRVITRLLPDAQRGKGEALNAAWRAIDESLPAGADRHRVLVGVLDADSRLERLGPDVICGYLVDPRVAAVQVQVRVTDDIDGLAAADLDMLVDPDDDLVVRKDSWLVQLQDLEFTGPIAAMQSLRRRTGSVGMGGNGQFTRMAALDRIADEFGTPWHGALLEDFELGLHVLLTGGRTEYCDETFVAQTGLPRIRPLLRQRSRWAQGGMQCLRYLWRIICSPQVSLPGALEIAYYLWVPWSQLLGSVVFPAAMAVQVYYMTHTGDGVGSWWSDGAWGLVPLAALFGVLPHVVWGPVYRSRSGGSVSRRRAVALGLLNVAYAYLLQAAVWWAFTRILRGRRDWKKTARSESGGPPRPGPPAPGRAVPRAEGSVFAALPPGPAWAEGQFAPAEAATGRLLLEDPPTAAQPAVPGGSRRPAVRPAAPRSTRHTPTPNPTTPPSPTPSTPSPAADPGGPRTERIPPVLTARPDRPTPPRGRPSPTDRRTDS